VIPLLVATLVLAPPPFKVTLTAPTHTPRVNARWNYKVEAVDRAGRAVRGRITVQIVDPFGGVHPVEFGRTTRPIVNFRFAGTFRDWVEWPFESRGFRLTFRVTVTSAGKTVRRSYWVRPR
jgi:hypothetical protein